MRMKRTTVTPAELQSMEQIADNLAARFSSVEDFRFMRQAVVIAQELPLRIRQTLYEFKLSEPACGVCQLTGLALERAAIGPTPTHWQNTTELTGTLPQQFLLVLLGSLLGEVMGWSTQQNGMLVHQVFPIRDHEHEQLGTGSRQLLWWHNEDAFHPFRPDYVCLLCLRNPDRVPTTIASLENENFSEEELDILFAPHFTIRPDESHQRMHRGASDRPEEIPEDAYRRIEQMSHAPDKIAVLFGDRRDPYIRLDPYFMDTPTDAAARQALAGLRRRIDARLMDLVLEAGDICFIDNFKAVHGRRPFQARFDGTDRWLMRVNVTRDLRKSRASRSAPEVRVL